MTQIDVPDLTTPPTLTQRIADRFATQCPRHGITIAPTEIVILAVLAADTAAPYEPHSDPNSRPREERLTRREYQVLVLMACGYNTADIADELILAPDTVKTHIHNIAKRLGADGRVDTVVRALVRGDLDLAEILAARSHFMRAAR